MVRTVVQAHDSTRYIANMLKALEYTVRSLVLSIIGTGRDHRFCRQLHAWMPVCEVLKGLYLLL